MFLGPAGTPTIPSFLSFSEKLFPIYSFSIAIVSAVSRPDDTRQTRSGGLSENAADPQARAMGTVDTLVPLRIKVDGLRSSLLPWE